MYSQKSTNKHPPLAHSFQQGCSHICGSQGDCLHPQMTCRTFPRPQIREHTGFCGRGQKSQTWLRGMHNVVRCKNPIYICTSWPSHYCHQQNYDKTQTLQQDIHIHTNLNHIHWRYALKHFFNHSYCDKAVYINCLEKRPFTPQSTLQ